MDLPGNEVHLYFTFPEEISDPALLKQYESLLTDDELAQQSRLYFARHRHQYLVTRALIRSCLSSYFKVDPAAWKFGKNGYGKPEISFPSQTWPVHFNLSHCEGLIMCGITGDDDIGVDAEDTHRTTRAAFESLTRYFSAEEIEALNQLPAEQQKQRFFDYWTLKESYIKARGMGLAIPLDKFSFQFKADRLNGFELHPDLQDDATNWQFWRMPIAERYQVAVAVNSGSDLNIRTYRSVPLQNNESLSMNFL